MGEGLRRFAEGLSSALSEKAARNSRPLREQLFHELDEIQLLCRHLEGVVAQANDEQERDAARGFLGIVYMCRFLMADLRHIDDMQDNLGRFIANNADRMIEILKLFEAKFEDNEMSSSVLKARMAWDAVKRLK